MLISLFLKKKERKKIVRVLFVFFSSDFLMVIFRILESFVCEKGKACLGLVVGWEGWDGAEVRFCCCCWGRIVGGSFIISGLS